jgi:hypothetical protein
MPSLYVFAGTNVARKTTFIEATQLRVPSRLMKRQGFETGLSGFLGFTGFCWVW